MAMKAPDIDSRSAADIVEQVTDLLGEYAPEWNEFDPATGKPGGMSAALINIFARYCEIIIQRVNQAPEKNFLAYLDMLGASLQPPQAARVPLTFFPAAGSAVPALVPAGTQAAAPPVEGEKEPVIFETERELVATPAQLVAAYTREPGTDRYADRSRIITAPVSEGVAVFQGVEQVEHIFYLSHDDLLALSPVNTLSLAFMLAASIANADPRDLKWEFWDGAAWQEKIPASDGTSGLTQTGIVAFSNLTALSPTSVNGLEKRWLRCRLVTPVTTDAVPASGMVRASQLPQFTAITLKAELDRENVRPDRAFSGAVPVDLNREFYPFGEKPKFGDVLYIASGEVFSRAATVELKVVLINPSDGPSDSPPKAKAAGLELRWEFWNGEEWKTLTVSDTTANLTKSGSVSFTFPEQPAAQVVNGAEECWVRVRIVAGNYGEDVKYVLVPATATTPASYTLQLATFAPPIIDTVQIDYTYATGDEPVEAVVAYNDFHYENLTAAANLQQTITPLHAAADTRPALYLAFQPPSGKTAFPNRTMSVFNRVTERKYGDENAQPAPGGTGGAAERLNVSWEYWNGEWTTLAVRDDSENFTRMGGVELLPPADFVPNSDFGLNAYWLRAVWKTGVYSAAPRLSRILLNTVMASRTMTVKNEVLGSSDLSDNQTFQTIRKPVLDGQQLEVREPELPPANEQTIIRNSEGEDAITTVLDSAGRPREIWVRWREVSDFYGSGPRDRHYVIDHLTGEIRFGDGLNGMIPPRGSGNIRLKQYRTGGGAAGNRAAGTVVQLKTTVPYIEKVINTEAASGGTDAESMDLLYDRAPRTIRHRNRAVTIEDFEDLAMLASPGVARARCVPLRNLAADPLGDAQAPGEVSVIIVPSSEEPMPLPASELIDRVQDYLEQRGDPTANLSVVGPRYVQVDVTVEVALASPEGASAVEQAVRSRLDAFLHPLTGGLDGKGWDFGREPHNSDLCALIMSVPGVDHIRALSLDDAVTDKDGSIKKTGRFLVCSGDHMVTLVFE